MIEKVEGEVVDRGYEEIVEEVKRKLQEFCHRAHVTSKELVVLMPRKDFNTLENTVLDVLIGVEGYGLNRTICGAELNPCGVDKIYVTFREVEQ